MCSRHGFFAPPSRCRSLLADVVAEDPIQRVSLCIRHDAICPSLHCLLQLLADIVAEGPDTERIVMTMTYTYKAAGQLGGITKVGAAAAVMCVQAGCAGCSACVVGCSACVVWQRAAGRLYLENEWRRCCCWLI